MILGTLVQGQPGNTLVDKLISHTYGPSYYNSRITTLGGYKFYANTALNTIDCPNVTTIGWATFQSCTNIRSAYFPSCTYVGGAAFQNCSNLTSLTIPWNEISYISTQAFDNCQKLPISISNNLISGTLAPYVFRSCYSLTYVSLGNVSSTNSGPFWNCNLLEELHMSGCTNLSTQAFYSCKKLSIVDLPNLTTLAGDKHFAFCSLPYIDFPILTTTATSQAFSNCSYASYARLPKVGAIASGTFSNCYELQSAYFEGTGAINSQAFANNRKLLSLYLLGSTMRTLQNVNVFGGGPISNVTSYVGDIHGSIFVPSSLYASYIAATNWITYSDRFVSMTDQEILALRGSWVSTITASFTYPQSKAIYTSDGLDALKSYLSVTQTLYNGTSSVLSATDYIIPGPTISAGYNGRYAVKEQRGIFRFIATIDAELPEGYTRVGYLQTSGTQYIDTELTPEQDDQYVFEHTANDTTNANGLTYVIGANPITGIRQSANYVEIFWAGTKAASTAKYYAQNNGSGSNVAVGQSNVMSNYPNAVITYSKGEFSFTKTGTLPTVSYYVFATNNNGIPDFGSKKIQRIWYVEIPNRLKLIPCIRNSDNTVGMYDLMGNICSLTNTPFFINAGTGSFTYGYNP